MVAGSEERLPALLGGYRVLDASTEGTRAAAHLLSELGADVVPLPECRGTTGSAAEWLDTALPYLGTINAVLLELPRDDGLTGDAVAEALVRQEMDACVVEVSFYGMSDHTQPPLHELLLQAASGILDQTGDARRGCCRLGGQIARTILSAEVASTVVLGLRNGQTGVTRVSAQAALASCSGQPRVVAQLGGEEPARGGAGIYRGGRRLRLVYETTDGLIVCPYHPTNMLRRLENWLRDTRQPDECLASMSAVVESGVFRANQRDIDILEDGLSSFFGAAVRDDLVEEGQRRGLVIAPVNDLQDVLVDVQLASQDAIAQSSGSSIVHAPYRIAPLSAPVVDDASSTNQKSDEGARPLSGTSVVAFTTFVAGPVLGKWLADLGADVWRIESAGAMDFVRATPPLIELDGRGPISAVFANINAGVQSLALDMNVPEEADCVRRLIQEADVVIENSRPGLLEKWGLTTKELATLNPKLVILRMSGMGQTGPRSSHRAVGHTLAGLSGQLNLTGWTDEFPTLTSVPTADYLAPALGLFGVVSALDAVGRSGHGYAIDLSQFSGVVYSMSAELAAARMGKSLARLGLLDPLNPQEPVGVFRSSDGHEFIVVDRATKLPLEEGVDGTRPQPAALEEWLAQTSASASLPLDDALRECERQGLDAAPVLKPSELTLQPWLREPLFYRRLAPVTRAEVLIDGSPIPFGGPDAYDAPLFGEQTDAVLADALGSSVEKAAAS